MTPVCHHTCISDEARQGKTLPHSFAESTNGSTGFHYDRNSSVHKYIKPRTRSINKPQNLPFTTICLTSSETQLILSARPPRVPLLPSATPPKVSLTRAESPALLATLRPTPHRQAPTTDLKTRRRPMLNSRNDSVPSSKMRIAKLSR